MKAVVVKAPHQIVVVDREILQRTSSTEVRSGRQNVCSNLKVRSVTSTQDFPKTYKKWQLVSSYVARKTFVTGMVRLKIS